MATYARSSSLLGRSNTLVHVAVSSKCFRRSFSQTIARLAYSPYPVFVPTANAELDKLLSDLRYHQILPHYLTEQQLKVKKRAKSDQDASTVRIGGVDEMLRYIRLKEVPQREKLIRSVLERCKAPADWQNVYKLLEGFHGGRQKPRQKHKRLLLQGLAHAKQTQLLVQAIVHADRTGATLAGRDVLFETMILLNEVAAQDVDDISAHVKVVLGYAEEIAKASETEAHVRPKESDARKQELWLDPQRHPIMAAVPLTLTRKLLSQNNDNTGLQAKSLAYATRLVALVKNYLEPLTNEITPPEGKSWNITYISALRVWIIISDALNEAQTTLGASSPDSSSALDMRTKIDTTIRDSFSKLQRYINAPNNTEQAQKMMAIPHVEQKYSELQKNIKYDNDLQA